MLLQWTDAMNDHSDRQRGTTRQQHELFFGPYDALEEAAVRLGWQTVILWAPRAGHLFALLQDNVARLRLRLPTLTLWVLGTAPWTPAAASGAARASLWGRSHPWLRSGAVAEILFLREPVAAVRGDLTPAVREDPLAAARLGPAEGPLQLGVESWLADTVTIDAAPGLMVECMTDMVQLVWAWLRSLQLPGVTSWHRPLPAPGVSGRSRMLGLMPSSTEHARHTALRHLASVADDELCARSALLWCSTDIWDSAEALLASVTSAAAVTGAARLWTQAVMTTPKQALVLTTTPRDTWVQLLDAQASDDDRFQQLSLRPVLTSGSLWARPRGLRPTERLQLYGTAAQEADLLVVARVDLATPDGVEALLQQLVLQWAARSRHPWTWVADVVPPAGGASWATRGRQTTTHEILLHAPSLHLRDNLLHAIRGTAVTDAIGVRRVAAAIPTSGVPPPGGGRRGRGAGASARRR
jgi:hypothetical protein